MSSFPKPSKRMKHKLKMTKILRESVINRDSSTCQICGSKATQLHHILYKSYSGDDISQNLICLCNSCHRKVHNNGKKWFPILLDMQRVHYSGLTKEDLKCKKR